MDTIPKIENKQKHIKQPILAPCHGRELWVGDLYESACNVEPASLFQGVKIGYFNSILIQQSSDLFLASGSEPDGHVSDGAGHKHRNLARYRSPVNKRHFASCELKYTSLFWHPVMLGIGNRVPKLPVLYLPSYFLYLELYPFKLN